MFSSHVARQSFGDRKQAFVASGKRAEGDVHADVVTERKVQDAVAAGDWREGKAAGVEPKAESDVEQHDREMQRTRSAGEAARKQSGSPKCG